jgi:hypothetical protein
MDVTFVTVVVYFSCSDLLKNRNPEFKKHANAPAFIFIYFIFFVPKKKV